MEAKIKLELTYEESELVRKALGLFSKSQVVGYNEDGSVITKETPDGRDLWREAYYLDRMIEASWKDFDSFVFEKPMIRNGDVIQGYTILATANGMALAHSKTAPDPYVVWFIDEDGCGVRNGRYQQTKEDAEWDFCCKAFPWFEDNAPVNMIEDEAAERIEEFQKYLDKARSAIDSAEKLVEDMVLEHGRLQGKKEAPQEESTEQDDNKRGALINGYSLNQYGYLYFFQTAEELKNISSANFDLKPILGNGGSLDQYYPGVYAALQRIIPDEELPEAQKIKENELRKAEYPVLPLCTNQRKL